LVRFRNEHLAWEEGKCNSFLSSPQYLEYCPWGIHKGSGVELVCGLLGIELQNSYAAGDEENDISMLKAAGTGIAMKNATEKVKKSADKITEFDNDCDGVAHIIDQYF